MTTGTDTTSRTRLADLPADDPMIAYLTGSTGFFSSAADLRFSYCLYVPRDYRATGERMPLLVSVHGAGRDAERARDVFAGFAEEYRCVIMAPLLPMTASDLGSIHNYKQISYGGIRFDHVVLDMVAEVGEVWGLDVDRFLLFGFSAGGQFVHRFAYLHPDRLAALSVGAPGRITRPDPSVPWPDGLGGTAELTAAPDLVALRAVPVQLVVGECDTEISLTAGPAPADPGASRNRVENARLLHGDLTRGGVTAELAEVAGAGHHMLQVIPEVQEFFARQIRR
jgi:pimeloyl-ACP methyl ester carboxylesterase